MNIDKETEIKALTCRH